MIKYDARMTGEPTPSKNWFINKKRLENGKEGVKLDEEDHRLKLVIACCNRSHNGQYQIKASNTAGSDEVTLDVTVLGMTVTYCKKTGIMRCKQFEKLGAMLLPNKNVVNIYTYKDYTVSLLYF